MLCTDCEYGDKRGLCQWPDNNGPRPCKPCEKKVEGDKTAKSANICPILSLNGEKRRCMHDECAMWGVVGYKPLYPAWMNVGDRIARGDPLDEPIHGCTMCFHVPAPLYNVCCLTDCSDKPND